MIRKEPQHQSEYHSNAHEVLQQPEEQLQRHIAQLHTYALGVLYEKQRPLTVQEYELMNVLRDARGSVSDTTKISALEIPNTIVQIQTLLKVLSESTNSEDLSDYYRKLSVTINTLTNALHLLPPSRRRFLKIAALLGLGAATLGATPFAVHSVDHAFRRYNGLVEPEPANPEDDSYEASLAYIKQRYGLDIYTGLQHALSRDTDVKGESLLPAELAQIIPVLRAELGKYPPDIFSRFNSKTIRIVKDLRLGGERKDGLYRYADEILINYSSPFNASYAREVLHHEKYHLFDFNENGYMSNENRRWEELNACECVVYDRYVDPSRNRPNQTSEAPLEQFARGYGRTNELEDRATIAQALLVSANHIAFDNETARLRNLGTPEGLEFARIRDAKKDQVLFDYFRFSNGRMDIQFWEDLRQGRVSEGYFS